MEDYAAKMALKSDAALREYVTGHAQYREDAVLAALDELRRRGQLAPEEAALRPQLEVVVQQQAAERASASASVAAAETPVPEGEQPVLYTPGVIVLFSVMFNTILAGAVLLALNLRQVKRSKAIWGLAAFVLAYMVGESLLLNGLLRKGPLNPLILPLLNLPAILAYVLWFWPRYVGTYQFRSHNWLMPLLVCLVVMLGIFLLGRYAMQHLPNAQGFLKQSMQQ